MAAANKLSFTIRRPTPVSRSSSTGADSDFKVPALPRHLSSSNSGASSPLSRSSPKPKSRTYDERDSSDEEETEEIELVTGFDQFGVQRLHEKKKPAGPLVIPALKNRDWREQARKRRNLFVPDATPATGADGSVGGLGTRDSINSGPQLAGIHVKQTVKVEETGESMEVEEETEVVETTAVPKVEESEDQRAIRALLASAQRDGSASPTVPQIDIIPVVTEDAAYQQDVEALPESATLEDYERVPVSQFGAALLRGMGWKEGTGASRSGKGPVQPFLPQARPALLGIGAKEREVLDDGSKRRKPKGRDRTKYIPVLKRDRSENDAKDGRRDDDVKDGSREGSTSRRRTPSPDRRGDRDRHDSGYDRHRDGDRRREDRDYRDRDRDYKGRDRDYKERDRDYKERERGATSRHDSERSSDRRRDSDRRGR